MKRLRAAPECSLLSGLLAVWAVLGCLPLAAQPKPTEYEVKAAYLANFGKFVTWPARSGVTSDAPFQICILGQDPFGPTLDAAVAGETINGQPEAAKRISNSGEATDCRVLFISSSKDAQLKTILADLNKSSILTVGEMPQFCNRGGMVQFVLTGNRVRFQINLSATANAGLMLSSELLKVALVALNTP